MTVNCSAVRLTNCYYLVESIVRGLTLNCWLSVPEMSRYEKLNRSRGRYTHHSIPYLVPLINTLNKSQ